MYIQFYGIHLGGSVVVKLEGRNALALDAYAGNLVMGANLGADGGNALSTFGGNGILVDIPVLMRVIFLVRVLGHLSLLQQMDMGQPTEVMDLEMQDNMVIGLSMHCLGEVQEDLQL